METNPDVESQASAPSPPAPTPSLHDQLVALLAEYKSSERLLGPLPPVFNPPPGPLNLDLRYAFLQSDLRGCCENNAETIRGSALTRSDFEKITAVSQGLLVRPAVPDLKVREDVCPKMKRNKTSHLTGREHYDVYIENVAATLQGNLVRVEGDAGPKTTSLGELGTEQEVDKAKRMEEREAVRIEREQSRILGDAEAGDINRKSEMRALNTMAASKAELYDETVQHKEGTITDAEAADKISVALEEALRSLWDWKSKRGLNPFRQKLDEPFFKIYTTYRQKVAKPMDLPTMKEKNSKKLYQSTKAFALDVQLMINNCIVFNPKGTDFYDAALEIGALAKTVIKEAAKKEKKINKKRRTL